MREEAGALVPETMDNNKVSYVCNVNTLHA